jgi:hypothetical protein
MLLRTLIKQAASIGTIAILIVVLPIILSTRAPPPLQPQFASTIGITSSAMLTQVTMTGTLHYTVETPECFPKCLFPSVIFAYITANGENYILQGAQPEYPDGTQITVSGWLHTPSVWPTGSYKTGVAFAGSIAVTSIQPATQPKLLVES